MSFGDPNNPYGQQQGGQQPGGQQPGYGYPQQAPQGVPQQGYGYPQAPPVQGGYGFPGAPTEMPGGVKAARIMLYVLGGFQVIGAIVMVVAGAWLSDKLAESESYGSSSASSQDVADIGMAVFVVVGILTLGIALWAILTAAKFSSGGNGVRISAIVYGSLVTLFSAISLLTTNVFAIISIALGVLVIVFCARQDGAAWFRRQRQQY
ncbi:hypothetical protein ACIREO_10945 [Streptomyces sp. NPDC102441]|uniref:hypothetical protein n=1 Tax=Streptomyces sp. NPDC102441 TaxID=3366176 RepID=UPI0038214D31